MKKLNYTEELKFIPLNKLFLEDTEEIKKIKSIYQRELKYVQFLGPIESFIAYYYYYDNPKLKDMDVKKAIINVRTNWDKDINFFEPIFEKELIGVISFALQNTKRKITKHELFLILGYILWSIDNRKITGDTKGYLNWICNFFHLFNKEEKKRFDNFYDRLGKKFGNTKEEIRIMKNEGKEVKLNFSATQKALNILDSEKFADYGDELWEKGFFSETLDSKETEEKMKTFHKKHNEDMNFNCKKCNKKISAHNKDWHDGMCDDCFDKEYFKED